MLRVSPVDAIEHVAKLGARNRHDAPRWRGLDETAALEPLGVERHAVPIVPQDSYQVAALAPEHVKVARVRVALQRLLHLECKAIHAAAHIGVVDRDPEADRSRNRVHIRPAAMTRCSIAKPTSAPTRMQVPSGSTILIRRFLAIA